MAGLFATSSAMAAEITVLSGGAIEPGLHAASHAFEKETGHHVKITFNTAPQIAKRIAGGDVFDVIFSPPAGIEQFSKDGKVGAGDRVNVGKVGLGVAVRPGAPVPDISSVDGLQKSIL
jgi:molybdate transport system substrate-binding protein